MISFLKKMISKRGTEKSTKNQAGGLSAYKKQADSLSAELDSIRKENYAWLLETNKYELLGNIPSNVNEVLKELQFIINNSFDLTFSIINASKKMAATSQTTSQSIEEISHTIEQIAQGAASQANDAQEAVNIVNTFSEHIGIVHSNFSSVKDDTNKMNDLTLSGFESVKVLRMKSDENFNASEAIFAVMEKLTLKIKDISSFVKSIESIADQTNLLALNAAIEAARAGEAGRGFAVVADEVRKLADKSKQSTDEINTLMKSVLDESEHAAKTMNVMIEAARLQNNAVSQTFDSINEIAGSIKSIVEKSDEVNSSISLMLTDKDEVTRAIENISAITQETAASSIEVSSNAQNQMNTVKEMKKASKELNVIAQMLETNLRKYKKVN